MDSVLDLSLIGQRYGVNIFRRDAGDGVLRDHVPRGHFRPSVELSPDHPGTVGDDPRRIHGVDVLSLVEINRELLLPLDGPSDFF